MIETPHRLRIVTEVYYFLLILFGPTEQYPSTVQQYGSQGDGRCLSWSLAGNGKERKRGMVSLIMRMT